MRNRPSLELHCLRTRLAGRRRVLRSTPLLLAVVAFGCPDADRDAPRTQLSLEQAAPAPVEPREGRGQQVQPEVGPERTPEQRAAEAEAARKVIGTRAHARVLDAKGQVVGRATFYPVPVGVAVSFEGSRLPPGPRGFHIHEHGVCDATDGFASAGGHWSPIDREHGLENPEGPHVGDMPNLVVDPDGTADLYFVLPGATLRPEGARSLLTGDGTSLVIHGGEDDLETDPDGRAGPRIACGVVEAAPSA